jgi:3-deoxy-manno-octulosonate cytidylyltransferase (CMP-KDO synthetase)
VKTLAVIPARYASERLPGKPLLLLADRPMIQWVYCAVSDSGLFDEVVVASDDQRVVACVEAFGGRVELTRASHRTGTERVAEVAARRPAADVVVNVQGDQPFISDQMLADVLRPYATGAAPETSTIACPLVAGSHRDPHVVKVVCDQDGNALLFSRAPIPHGSEDGEPALHHLGVYGFRGDFLPRYAALAETPLERCERLEQLRILEHGYRIVVTPTEEGVVEVNTADDYARAQRLAATVRT